MNVYLVGPMDNVSQEYQKGWRNRSTEYLNAWEIGTFDPTRRPHSDDLSEKEIYALDLIDMKNSDLILVDLRMPSWGTAMEIMYAYEVLKLPIIGWDDSEVTTFSVFLDVTVTRAFKTLDEALDHITRFYTR